MRPSRILGPVLVALVSIGARFAVAQETVALLPAGARVVVAVRDGMGFWERLRGTGLYAALSSLPRVREGAAGHVPIDEAAWLTLAGRQAAIGVYDTEGGEPEIVVVTEIADVTAAREAISALSGRFGGEREIAWEIAGKHLVAGTSRLRVAALLDRAAGRGTDPGMSAHPAWAEATGRHPQAAVVAWVDLEAFDEVPRPGDRPFARWIAIGLRWVEGGLRGDAYLALAPDSPSEILALATARPAPIRSTSIFPASTLLALAATGFDARALLTGLRRADPEAAEGVTDWEARTGIDVESELVPAFGREMGLSVIGLEPSFLPFPIPVIAAVIEVRDSTRARLVFDRLERWGSEELLRERSIALAWQSETHHGITIRYAPTPFGETLEGAYAVTPSFAIVGSSRSAVRALLDAAAARAPSLSEGVGFGAMKRFLPEEASAMVYLDLAGLAAGLVEVARGFGRLDADREPAAAAIRAVLESTPRLGLYAEPDGEAGVWWRGLLEVR